MRLFLAGTSFLPVYGGPAYSVSQLALALAEVGVQVGLWAPDQSTASSPLLPVGLHVMRLTGSEAEALDSFGPCDVLHDNGLWWPHNHRLATLASERGVPRVVSTRGMLEPWAISHKRWRKNFAWWIYQRRDLTAASCIHASAEAEAGNVRCFGLGVPIHVIPNGVHLPAIPRKPAQGEKRTALFLGRIYPVKGLPMLVEAWARIRPEGWRLQIAGPDEAGHRGEVERAIKEAGIGEVVSFLGAVEGPAKTSALTSADLFVLPTYSESFGMAIAEALAHGLPVLTTTAAPWPMLTERGCGWTVVPTVDGVAEGLRRATSCGLETLRAMGKKGRDLAAGEYKWADIANKFVALYSNLATC